MRRLNSWGARRFARLGRLLSPILFLASMGSAAQSPLPSLVFTETYIAQEAAMTDPHPYIGLWVTADGYIRHELLPNGRYREARGTRENAYEGRYAVKGTHIDYWDDTGFTADGDFIGGVLHHAGMILYRR
ncbi:Atu4866 domain-containing protein [Elstera litoralis]|nr:Atu4866 domain-containing protein [Elstera litoralis]